MPAVSVPPNYRPVPALYEEQVLSRSQTSLLGEAQAELAVRNEQSAAQQLNVSISALIRRLFELQNLSENWDSYGAQAPSKAVLERIRKIIAMLWHKPLLATLDRESRFGVASDIVPSAQGGAALVFTKREKCAYIEVLNSGGAIIALDDSKSDPYLAMVDVSESGLTHSLAQIRTFLSR